MHRDRHWTYRELNERANRLGRVLLAHGVRPGARIGLIFDDALWSYVAMLATLKINGGCAETLLPLVYALRS